MRSRRNLPVLSVAAAPITPDAELPHDNASAGPSMAQITTIVWAYRKHALIIAGATILLAALFAKSLSKTYTATATLMFSNETNEPLAGAAPGAPQPSNNIQTEVQLMLSAEVLLPVIDRLELTKMKHYTAGHRGEESTLPSWAKDVLVKDLEIVQGQYGSQLVYVTATASDPVLASKIANSVAEIYLDQERQRVYGPASERARRYAQELGELKNKVHTAQDQVTAFRQRTGVTDAAAKNNNIEADLLSSLETRLQEVQSARRNAEVRAIANQDLSTGAAGTPEFQALKSQLNLLREQLAQMRATLGSKHPKVLEIQSQIDATQRNLAGAAHSFSNGASSDLSAARQLESKLRSDVEEQRRKVLSISRLQDEGTKYVLELDSAQSVYKRALDGYDQIMFASGAHNTNIYIVSRAAPPQKPSKPNIFKILLLGVGAGLLFGFLGPLVYELLINRRIRCRDDFERDFAVPVLVEFNAIGPTLSAA